MRQCIQQNHLVRGLDISSAQPLNKPALIHNTLTSMLIHHFVKHCKLASNNKPTRVASLDQLSKILSKLVNTQAGKVNVESGPLASAYDLTLRVPQHKKTAWYHFSEMVHIKRCHQRIKGFLCTECIPTRNTDRLMHVSIANSISAFLTTFDNLKPT